MTAREEDGAPAAERTGPLTPTSSPTGLAARRRLLRGEVLAVLAVSLGANAVVAVLSFVRALTAPEKLADQRAPIVGLFAPGRPWLELIYQLVNIVLVLAPIGLVVHLLHRGDESLADLGVDRRRPRSDLARGAALAAVIGAAGLVLYLVAYALGLNRAVVPSQLPPEWWRVPLQILIAAQNGVLEEVLVAGYLLRRLDQLGWSPGRAVLVSALLRGTYHLYQGVGGFVGNLIMGLIFGRLYQRWARAAPLVVAHTLIDVGAFVGYTLLVGRVDWIPG